MIPACTQGWPSEAPLWDRIKSGGTKAQQALSSWLTGDSSLVPTLGFLGAGSATSDTAAHGGPFGIDRPARQSRAVAAPRGFGAGIFSRDIERPARRHGRVDTVRTPRSIRLSASHRMAATHGRRTGRLGRTTQLGSITPALQSAWRTQRRDACTDQAGSTRLVRTILRASLCQHTLRQRVLFAGAARREAPEIRSLRLRALP